MRKTDNLPPYRAVVMKSGSLNFLEPSGPVMEELYFTLLGLDLVRNAMYANGTPQVSMKWGVVTGALYLKCPLLVGTTIVCWYFVLVKKL